MAIQLQVTDAAEEKLRELTGNPMAKYIRIEMAQACGCGTMGYRMQWEHSKRFGDLVLRHGGIALVIDRKTKPTLNGGVIDFNSDPMQEGFVIDSPHKLEASQPSGCGCGGGPAQSSGCGCGAGGASPSSGSGCGCGGH